MSRASRLLPAWLAACLLAPLNVALQAAQAPPRPPSYCPHCVECQARPGSPRSVGVKLYNQSRLDDAALLPLLDVANRIWLPYGVQIQAVTRTDGVALVVGNGHRQPATRAGGLVLGDTLFSDSHATPYIRLWLGAAELVATDASTPNLQFVALPARERDDVLVQMMGVAFAHELAHYLLDTGTHSDRGLLRAALTAGEFERPDLARLELTPAQQRVMCSTGK